MSEVPVISLENSQPERTTPAGVLERTELGKLASYLTGVEIPAAIASIATSDPLYAEMGGYLDAVMIDGALYGGHMHHVNRVFRNLSPLQPVIKDRSEV